MTIYLKEILKNLLEYNRIWEHYYTLNSWVLFYTKINPTIAIYNAVQLLLYY